MSFSAGPLFFTLAAWKHIRFSRLWRGGFLDSLPDFQSHLSVSLPNGRVVTVARDVPRQCGVNAQEAHTTQNEGIPWQSWGKRGINIHRASIHYKKNNNINPCKKMNIIEHHIISPTVIGQYYIIIHNLSESQSIKRNSKQTATSSTSVFQ